jgi:futalosine hydrolase
VLLVAATERELARVRGWTTFVCGVGPIEAAARTARMLAEREPHAVLHVGIAGARNLEPLSVVIGSEAVYADISAQIQVVDRVAPDAALFDRIRRSLPDAHVASISTSAAVGGRAEVEAMEGFGVLRACELAGVPAVELRVISNTIGESDRSKWRFEEAFEVLAETLDGLDVV